MTPKDSQWDALHARGMPRSSAFWAVRDAKLASLLAKEAATKAARPPASRDSSHSQRALSHDKAALQAATRKLAYTGSGRIQAGRATEMAEEAAASAAEELRPTYIWPAEAPLPLSTQLTMGTPEVQMQYKLVRSIQAGIDNLAETHIPVTALAAAVQLSQVFDLEDLHSRAEAAAAATAEGRQPLPAVVPDSSRPFTISMWNGQDGRDYVVAHYEPCALQYCSSKKAALLCEIFHRSRNKMERTSAGMKQNMVMAGMRATGGFSRYASDTGETQL